MAPYLRHPVGITDLLLTECKVLAYIDLASQIIDMHVQSNAWFNAWSESSCNVMYDTWSLYNIGGINKRCAAK